MPSSDQPSLADVAAAHAAGKMEEARGMCERILEATPDDGDARMWLGLVAMAQLRWTDAASSFETALRVRPDPWTVANLGNCYLKLGQLDDALGCFNRAIALKPSLYPAHLGLAAVLHGMERFEEALARIDQAAGLPQTDYQLEARRGCTLAALGRYEEAQEACERAAALAGRFVYPKLVKFDRSTFDAISTGQHRFGRPHTEFACDRGDVRAVVLVSCTAPYARRYGFPFIRSYAEYARRNHLLHFHVFDPDASIVEEIRAVAHKSGLPALTITSEHVPFPERPPHQRKGYYACGRLLHLPFWLDFYGVPVLSLDTDFIVEAPLDPLFETRGSADVRLNPRDTLDSPWLDIIANIIVAYPTAASRAYFSAVGNYAVPLLKSEPDAWIIDQAALFCVLKMLERFGRPPRVEWIPQPQEALLWHLGHAYDYRRDDPRYLRYAGPA